MIHFMNNLKKIIQFYFNISKKIINIVYKYKNMFIFINIIYV